MRASPMAWVVLLLLTCLFPAAAQVTVQIAPQANPPTSTNLQTRSPSEVTVEFVMTPQEATRLLGAVDEVIEFDSRITGLPVRGHTERKITSRDELQQRLVKAMQETEALQEIQHSSVVLKKFGLLPRDFDFQHFAVQSATSQLAGYYDPRVKTMYLLNWLPTSAQLPVLAHELDHALQDQNFELQHWMKADDVVGNGATGGATTDQRSARRAVVEGHAMATMMEYVLSKRGRSLAQMPMPSSEMLQNLVDRFHDPRLTQAAPLMLRELGALHYMYGLMFVHQILRRAGKEQAYSGIFKRPPENTRQIMEPDTYLEHEKLPPLPMPAFDDLLGKDYEKLESGSMGEFDCMVLMKQFGSPDQQVKIPTFWRGDYFYAARRLHHSPEAVTSSAPDPVIPLKDVSLLFVSRWATPSAARTFAAFYRAGVPRKYLAQPLVSAAAGTPSQVDVWTTDEGKISVQTDANLVIVLESFDDELAARLQKAILQADRQ